MIEFSDFTAWQKAGTYGTAYFFSDIGALFYELDNFGNAVQDLNPAIM